VYGCIVVDLPSVRVVFFVGPYLADRLIAASDVASRLRLPSVVPRCRLNTYGRRRAFTIMLVRRPGTRYVTSSEIRRVVPTVFDRLIFRLRRLDLITDAVVSLHWLRVPERIVFKVAVRT